MRFATCAAPLVVLALSIVSTPIVQAYQADAWANTDSWSAGCLGYTDSYPGKIASLSKSAFSTLGYSPANSTVGSGFTRSAFLDRVGVDWAVSVMSHGDVYNYGGAGSAFLQDHGTGKCSSYYTDLVTATQIKAHTLGSPYNIVVMSTCFLGSVVHPDKEDAVNTMPEAFQIAKVKTASDPEFYLGWFHEVYPRDMYRYEKQLWWYLTNTSGASLSQAFAWAKANPPKDGLGGYRDVDSANPFEPNWFGSPTFNGVHKTSLPY